MTDKTVQDAYATAITKLIEKQKYSPLNSGKKATSIEETQKAVYTHPQTGNKMRVAIVKKDGDKHIVTNATHAQKSGPKSGSYPQQFSVNSKHLKIVD